MKRIYTGTYTHLESKNLGIGKTLTNEYYAQRAREAEERRTPKTVKKDGRELRSKLTDDEIAHSRWLYEQAGASLRWISEALPFPDYDQCRRIVVDYYTRRKVEARRVDGLPVPQKVLDKAE